MSRAARIVALLALVAGLTTGLRPVVAGLSIQNDPAVTDLAAVPLPPAELPEPGYQAMTGGFLDRSTTIDWIADPRRAGVDDVEEMLADGGWEAAYALDMVLLDDRAYVDSDILALVQTNLYDFADEDGADAALETMRDFGANPDAEEIDPATAGATTVELVTESGDTLRTLIRVGDVVLEVVTLETFRQVDPETHRAVVIATVDRLSALREAAPGVAPRALLIEDGAHVAGIRNASETGVHQIYRLRDGAVLPAAGELQPPDAGQLGMGLVELYQGSQRVSVGNGTGFYASWIGTFDSEASAAAFVGGLPQSSSGGLLPDPWFPRWDGEDVVAQGVAGLYRVSGSVAGERFSGTVEIRQHGPYVIGIGWRVQGSAMPSVDATSRLMDAQLACLDAGPRCAPLPAETLLAPGLATPVAPVTPAEGRVGSTEFGWSLAFDPAQWTVGERYTESGYDYVALHSDRSLVTLESVVDQHGDPQQCVLDELHQLQALEEHAAIDLGSDVAGEAPAGLERGHGWAIYTVEPLAEERADQEYTIRIDCYTLVEGAASLVMTETAPRDRWADEAPTGEMLREGLRLPAGRGSNGALIAERGHSRYTWRHTDAMIDRLWIPLAA